jgi:hypothetical protein
MNDNGEDKVLYPITLASLILCATAGNDGEEIDGNIRRNSGVACRAGYVRA